MVTAQSLRSGSWRCRATSGEHAEILETLGVEPVEVRGIEDLEGLAGIIVPGVESTAIGNLMVSSGLLDALRSFFYKGAGTCAGMVLAASATTGSRQPLLGLMNALVERNGFGRQVYSFEKDSTSRASTSRSRGLYPGAVLRERGAWGRGSLRD